VALKKNKMEQSIIDGLKSLFKSASEKDQTILVQKFGESFFKMSVFDRIKTFEDACKDQGISTDLPFQLPHSSLQRATNAFYKLDVINKSLLEGAVLDWEDSNQKKWYPWFTDYSTGSGFRFLDANCGWAGTNASGGARLCLDTQEKAKYFGTQFLDIWNDFQNPNK
jgi:hypothetical protein